MNHDRPWCSPEKMTETNCGLVASVDGVLLLLPAWKQKKSEEIHSANPTEYLATSPNETNGDNNCSSSSVLATLRRSVRAPCCTVFKKKNFRRCGNKRVKGFERLDMLKLCEATAKILKPRQWRWQQQIDFHPKFGQPGGRFLGKVGGKDS